MATVHVNGPAHCFVANFASNDFSYFGTSESGVKIVNRKEYDPVMNDLSGPKVPLDKTFASKISYVMGVFTRWDEGVYQGMSNAPNHNQLVTDILPGDMGIPMIQFGKSFRLVVQAPYGAAFNDPTGYIFYACTLMQDEQDPLGTRHKKLPLIWEALPVWVPALQGFQIYDTNLTGVVLPPIT